MSVLFACNFNHVRSPMAEAMMRHLYGGRVYVDSCGLQPGDGVDPMAAHALAELGVDASSHVAQSFDNLDAAAFDLIVSFTAEAHARAMALARGTAVQVEFWPLGDPTLTEGSREQVLDAYRLVRDRLRLKLLERFGPTVGVSRPGA